MKKSTKLTLLGYALMIGSWVNMGSSVAVFLATVAFVFFIMAITERSNEDK